MGTLSGTICYMNQRRYLGAFILLTSLFFLWAFLHNINGILIPHLKKACQLTDTQSAFIDTAVYLAYFSIALPAGWFMHRFGYKNAILLGLLLFGGGFLLFLPAASTRTYELFLLALFIGAAGATFLETVANPYITRLGDPDTATQRLNFAQAFNGVGAFVAPIIGGRLILTGTQYTDDQIGAMSPGQLQSYLQSEASTLRMPYLVIGVIVLVLLVVFWLTRLPEVKEEKREGSGFSFRVFRHPNFRWAVIAQFFYVGAQVCVGSFFIRYAGQVVGLPEKSAAEWLSYALIGFMAGRFVGTFLMRYIRPEKLLLLYSIINILLLALAVLLKGAVAVYALMAVPFFMSIMFPTIFALGIRDLGEETKIGSSFLVMSIVGGAIFPLFVGAISDATGRMQPGYIVPMLCFAVIAFFAWRQKSAAGAPVKLKLVHEV